jgi:phosphoglucomutase
MKEGITLYDRLQQLYARYGAYSDRVTSRTLPGKDGVGRMRAIMHALRENPPQSFGNIRVTAVRDYLKGIRTTEDKTEKIDLPASDVLYFELEGGSWLCVRPSGTEPKIKLYVSAHAQTLDLSDAMAASLCACASEKLN